MLHINVNHEFSFIVIFDNLTPLQVDSSGLVHHNSEYGVTLIIPEGAIQQSATVWFGVCLYSDKFKFGDYVPVTPIVWVHIDQKLHKCAKLYLPHDIVISSEADLQKFTVLTADDDNQTSAMDFYENYNLQVKIEPNSQIFEIKCPHFCTNCIAAKKRKYKAISRRYLIARADKENGSKDLTVEFIFLCQQPGCKKV